jgi:hypothetical protein
MNGVKMDGWIGKWMDGRGNGWVVDGRMNRWRNGEIVHNAMYRTFGTPANLEKKKTKTKKL